MTGITLEAAYIGAKLRYHRAQRMLDLLDLEGPEGLTSAILHQAESGRHMLSRAQLFYLAERLRLPLTTLEPPERVDRLSRDEAVVLRLYRVLVAPIRWIGSVFRRGRFA